MFRAKAQSFGRELAAHPVARAFGISLLAHFVLISGVEVGRQAGWWKHSLLSESKKSRLLTEVEKAEQQFQQQIQKALENKVPEAQLVFIEVDPATIAQEEPKNAKFYSSKNALAGNPDPGDKEIPKIDGKQDKVAKTFDTLKPDSKSLQPQPQQPKPADEKPVSKEMPRIESKTAQPKPEVEEDIRAPREEKPGETLVARAAPRPQAPQQEHQPESRRPRTLAEAKAQKGIIEGQKMRQEGGSRRVGRIESFDTKATPFGAYDSLFIAAVQSSWFNLLEQRSHLPHEIGKVVVEFRLNYDGSITGVRVVESEVNEHLAWTCQRAVLDVNKFQKFPDDMRRLVAKDYREIRFTFYYNQ